MVFSSVVFLCIFLPTVFLIYTIVPSLRAKNVILTIASIVFYAYGEPVFVFFLLLSVIIHFIAGRIALKRGSFSKALLVCLIIFDVASLAIFKYSAFFVESLNAVTGFALTVPQIRLPVGISFFTFQIMSYTIDCYRDNSMIQKSFTKLLLYISFFPQLIAGPIVKYNEIYEFLDSRKQTPDLIAQGIRRLAVGLSKKVLIANCAATVVDYIYGLDNSDISITIAWVAAIAYCIQIYFDFSGYSDMAIGMGNIFGFKFPENFNYPFVSTSIQEFWRRWHISLSTWFKLYVYIPMGGNKKGEVRTHFNRIFVFYLTGLWHGASLNFIIWGLFHGIIITLENIGIIPVNKVKSKTLRRLYTFAMAAIGFIVFRAETVSEAFCFVKAAFIGYGEQNLHLITHLFDTYTILIFIIAFFAMTSELHINKLKLTENKYINYLSYAASFILIVVCIINLISNAYNPFIYFRF